MTTFFYCASETFQPPNYFTSTQKPQWTDSSLPLRQSLIVLVASTMISLQWRTIYLSAPLFTSLLGVELWSAGVGLLVHMIELPLHPSLHLSALPLLIHIHNHSSSFTPQSQCSPSHFSAISHFVSSISNMSSRSFSHFFSSCPCPRVRHPLSHLSTFIHHQSSQPFSQLSSFTYCSHFSFIRLVLLSSFPSPFIHTYPNFHPCSLLFIHFQSTFILSVTRINRSSSLTSPFSSSIFC